MSTHTSTAEVTGFLAEVRSALDDLDGPERDELLGGLEADLQEAYDHALADSGTAPAWFADPAAYAAELRSSAGLPPRGGTPSSLGGTKRGGRSGAGLRQRAVTARDGLRDYSWWPWAESFGRALEPVWWVGRAWAVCAVLALLSGLDVGVVPGSGVLGLVVFGAALVASVQLGRGLWSLPENWQRRALSGVNVGAGLVLVIVGLAAVVGGVSVDGNDPEIYYETVDPSSADASDVGSGVVVEGEQATNLFVYGPDGKLIPGAQIVDQAGRPVVLAAEGETLYTEFDEPIVLTPWKNTYGAEVPNAYPVPQHRDIVLEDDLGDQATTTAPYNAHPPVVAVPPLATPSPTAGPSPTASPSPSPSD